MLKKDVWLWKKNKEGREKCGYSNFKYIKTTTYIIWSNVEFELELPTLAVMIPADMRPTSIWPL